MAIVQLMPTANCQGAGQGGVGAIIAGKKSWAMRRFAVASKADFASRGWRRIESVALSGGKGAASGRLPLVVPQEPAETLVDHDVPRPETRDRLGRLGHHGQQVAQGQVRPLRVVVGRNSAMR